MAKAKAKAAKSEETGSNVIPFNPANTGAMVLPEGVTVKRHVTLPSLAIKTAGQQKILFIIDAMRVSKITDKAGTDAEGKAKTREPATICTAGDCETGELVTFIVPAVVKSNLERDYPKDSYVGKSFVIQNKGKRSEAQRYNDFAIAEVDVPAGKFAVAK